MKKDWIDKRICDMEPCELKTQTYREYMNEMCGMGNCAFDLDEMSEENLNFLLERIREAEDRMNVGDEFVLNLV